MSLKKDKYIESAQKLIIKGQFEKAAQDLELAVELDPGDLKVRQKLAEILIRANRPQDAVSNYEIIGKAFANSSFYLKAIAVYKQIQKLTPENIKTTLILAELNVSHGLIGNALAEFSLVVNLYLKSGKTNEAIQLLERMLEIDPSNLNTMLKIAETNLAVGNSKAAYESYCKLAQQLWSRPDKATFNRLSERISTLFPDRENVLLILINTMLERGETAAAFEKLKEIIASSPDNLNAWFLMADTLRSSGDNRQLKLILEKINVRFPEEIRPVEDLVEMAVSDQDLQRALDLLERHESLLLEKCGKERVEGFYKELQNIFPDDELLLKALCSFYENSGNSAGLLDVREKLSLFNISEEEPVTEVNELLPQILEPEECPVIPETSISGFTEPAESVEPAGIEIPSEEWEVEVELGFDEDIAAEPEELPQPEPADEQLLEIDEEPEVFLSPIILPEEEPLEEITSDAAEEHDSLLEHQSITFEPDPDMTAGLMEALESVNRTNDTEYTEEIDVTEAPDSTSVELLEPYAEAVDETANEDITEEISFPEELDFQERTILTIENPLPLEAFLLQPTPDTEETLIPEPVQSSPWDEIYSTDQASDKTLPGAPPPADELVDLLVGHLESFDWGATDNRKDAFSTITPEHELQVEILSESDESDDHTAEPAFELEDLASFTEALFGDELSPDTENSESEEYSLGSMLSAFKKGVDEQLDESDTETRYSLGIAYKEMGLYDEAIQEFQAAGHDQARAADCIALQGICLKEKGDYEAAEAVFRSGLDLQILSCESMLNLKYELAQLLEQTENNDNALELYNEIIRVNPSYRNVQLHASRLSGEDDLDILIELNEDD